MLTGFPAIVGLDDVIAVGGVIVGLTLGLVVVVVFVTFVAGGMVPATTGVPVFASGAMVGLVVVGGTVVGELVEGGPVTGAPVTGAFVTGALVGRLVTVTTGDLVGATTTGGSVGAVVGLATALMGANVEKGGKKVGGEFGLVVGIRVGLGVDGALVVGNLVGLDVDGAFVVGVFVGDRVVGAGAGVVKKKKGEDAPAGPCLASMFSGAVSVVSPSMFLSVISALVGDEEAPFPIPLFVSVWTSWSNSFVVVKSRWSDSDTLGLESRCE